MEFDAIGRPNHPGSANTLRSETARVEAIVQAHQVAMDAALSDYRMGALARPFGGGKFWHLFAVRPRARLSLCAALAAGPTTHLRPVDLAEVDCVACLEVFTERTRP
jgi:hypothetical protein